MSDYIKIGVVIQGPLLSRGRTGATVDIPFFKVTQNDIVNYNCIKNISDLFSRYAHKFDDFVCVTWDTEDTSELESKIGKQAVMSIKDTTFFLPQKSSIITGNNKYRQFFSMLKGLERLAKNGCIYAIKIRTDQSLDLSKMKTHLLKVLVEEKNLSRILVPCGSKQFPYEVSDFYFGGRTQYLIDLCKVFLDKPELFPNSVAADIFFKCAWWFNDGSEPINQSFTAAGFHSKSQYFIIQSAWSKIFRTFSRELYETLIWRGKKFTKSHVDQNFYDDMSPADLSLLIRSKIKIRMFPKIYTKISKLLPQKLKKLLKYLLNV